MDIPPALATGIKRQRRRRVSLVPESKPIFIVELELHSGTDEPSVSRPFMPRLIETDCSAPGQSDPRENSPALFVRRLAGDARFLQPRYFHVEIVRHQIKIVIMPASSFDNAA
jgi:hypothetical protein